MKSQYSFFLCFLFFVAFCQNKTFAQESIFDSINAEFEKSSKEIDELFEYYNVDFVKWKDKVDLTKISLKPEKAKVNNYTVALNSREKIILETYKYIGVPYIWGGNNPKGFDCSGLVQWVIKKTHNVLIERTTKLQSKKWRQQLKHNLSDIKKGDLIYFKTVNNQISHVGIYTGNNKFVHAPNRKSRVKESELSKYWLKNFAGYLNLNTLLNK